MASESSSKRAQAMNDSFKSPSLTSSNRKESPLPSQKFEYKIEKTVPNPADAYDDNASNIQESNYSVMQNNDVFNPENVTKETIAKYVKFLKKQEKYDDGPDICDDVIERSQFNKKMEFDKGINRHTNDFVEKYFKEELRKEELPYTYEDQLFDDIKVGEEFLMSVDMFKSLLSPYQLIPSIQYSTLIKSFTNSIIGSDERYVGGKKFCLG